MPRGKLLNGLVTQQKVLRGAVTLFLEKGYTKTTTGEIAKAAGIGQSSFFHVFPSKEALLLELVKRMFSGQFALAGQHSGEQDPVLLYAVETALQLHIAELTEPLRELYVMAYSLPSIAAYLYKSTTKRLQVIFGPYQPEGAAQGLLRNGDRVRQYHAGLHVGSLRRVFHDGRQDLPLSGLFIETL